MKKNRISVADYLTQQIALSGVAQKDIAEAVGYDKPNMITMLKQGKTKIPINKIAPMAKSLGVDPLHFLRVAMQEYQPETWNVLEQLLGQRLVSEGEQQIIDLAREAGGGRNVYPSTDKRQNELRDLFVSWACEEDALAKPESVTKM